jgi:cell wall-associated NlpC family hydrolase
MWAADYIGRTDMHCWALIREVFGAHCGITLPTYGEVNARELHGVAAAVSRDASLPPWEPVKPFPGSERPFDVVVMKGWLPVGDSRIRRRGVVHVGVVTRAGHILHTDWRYAVVEVPLTHITVRGRLVGCYRHAAVGG